MCIFIEAFHISPYFPASSNTQNGCTRQQLNISLISVQRPLPLEPPGPPSCLLPIVLSVNLCSTSNRLSKQHHQPQCIYVNTVQYQIILLHGCVKWLGHPFGSSSLLTIFGCVSNPFSAQPWSCGSSAWRHCVSVDPYGASTGREGRTAHHQHHTRTLQV